LADGGDSQRSMGRNQSPFELRFGKAYKSGCTYSITICEKITLQYRIRLPAKTFHHSANHPPKRFIDNSFVILAAFA
jgi:hypothetical protein